MRQRLLLALSAWVLSMGALAGVAHATYFPGTDCSENCALLTGTLTHPRFGVYETMTLVAAGDPERGIWQTSFDPEGTARGVAPAGRYKILLGEGTWWGGQSHATARVVELRAGERKKVQFDSVDGAHIRLDVRDRRGDAVPFLRMNVRDAADPAELITSTTTTRDEVRVSLRRNRSVRIDLIDLSGRYAPRTVDPARLESTVVHMRPIVGPEPVYDPDPGRSGEIEGTISVVDWDRSRVQSRLFRADGMTAQLAANEVYDPDGQDGERNLRLRDVSPGSYKVQLTDGVWVGGDDYASADVVVVEPGQATRLDDHVPARGDVLGTVVSDRGVPLSDVLVTVYREGDPDPVSSQLTGEDPNLPRTGFALVGLPPANYQLRVSDAAGRIVDRWWGGGSNRASAATFRPTIGERTTLTPVTVATGLRATTSPKVIGLAQRGRTLKVSSNRWSVTGVKVKRQWLRDGRVIKGASGSSYRPTKTDRGRRLSVRVTGSKAGRPSVTITSRSTARVR